MHFPDSTFQTGIGHVHIESTQRDDLQLPNVVNFVALRETLLSEAPFVSRTNRGFWKKWIDSKQYVNVFAASLNFITQCISESGSINLQKLNNIKDDYYIEQMSINVSEMMLMNKAKIGSTHDLIFRKLPELLVYMIVNSLQSCSPRNARVYNSRAFREIILDWLGELLGGLRITDCKRDREWLYTDVTDVAIVIDNGNDGEQSPNASGIFNRTGQFTNNNGTMTNRTSPWKTLPGTAHSTNNSLAGRSEFSASGTRKSMNSSKQQATSLPNLSSAISQFSIDHSPLINVYLNLGRETKYASSHGMKMNLSHLPNRPLTNIRPEVVLGEGTFREKKIIDTQFKESMKLSAANRKQILAQHIDQQKSTLHDISRIRQSYRMQMSMLGSGNVTNKQLLAVAALDSATAERNADF